MFPLTEAHDAFDSGGKSVHLRTSCGCWWLSWAQDFLGLSRWLTLWAGVLCTRLRWRWSTTSGSRRSYTWVWGNRWRGPWVRCRSAVWWMCSPATQHRGTEPLIRGTFVQLCKMSACPASRHLLRLYPDQSHNSENSRRTACSWASRAPRRPRWCTRLSHLWAHHDQGCLVSLECHWPLDYPLCQGCLLAPACSYHTEKKTWKRGSEHGGLKKGLQQQQSLLLSNFLFHVFLFLLVAVWTACTTVT